MSELLKSYHPIIDKMEAEIARLHGNLNECTERGTEAERKIRELEEQYAQLDKDFSTAGEKDWENEDKLKEAERKMINQAHNHSLDYAKLEKTRANLKTATDVLKEAKSFLSGGQLAGIGAPNNTYIFQCRGDKVDAWHKALADIEGEMPYRHQGVGEYTGASNEIEGEKTEQIHGEPDWDWIILNAGDTPGYPVISQTLLWLEKQITTIEGTLSDVQAELIKQNNG